MKKGDIHIRFVDGYELVIPGEVAFRVDMNEKVVEAAINGHGCCNYFNFEQMQFIRVITEDEEA